MENTDIDMVTTIPDTPDREVRREVKRSMHSPVAPLRYQREEHRSHLNGRTRPAPEIGISRGNSGVQIENARASGSNALFRRAAVEKDKGKSIYTDPCVVRVEKNPVVNLNQRNGHAHVTVPSEDVRGFRLSNGCSPLRGDHNSFKLPRNCNKGKEKADCVSVSSRETIDLSSGKQHNRGTKRLVRYGCISPHAIAARAKEQTADTNSKDIVDVEQEISPETASSIAREIVSGNDIHGRSRGKRPEICRSRMGSRDAVGSEPEGWISTRGRKLNIGHEINRKDESDTHGICSSVSRLEVHETGAVEGEARQQQRRRKIKFTTSSRASNEPEVTVIDGEPSSSRPQRIHNHQRRRGTQVLEIDDSSPEVQVSRGPRRVENVESHVNVRQIEADEILARELQEQLYQEATLRDEQIDENIARLLEQEDNALRASSSRSSTRNSRSSSTVTANTGPRSRIEARLQQNSTRRRLNPPQTRASVRAPSRGRGRGQRLGRATTSLHRASNLSFPNDMNLEERLDFLEGLENALNHSVNHTNLLHMDRDFTEDDYELLLALDENNHRHGGASTHRINNLPESKVQTDNFQEACVICLETPTIGDTIRHLPCLHKFHKDCIDPWLGRSKSCPVCKSSVT